MTITPPSSKRIVIAAALLIVLLALALILSPTDQGKQSVDGATSSPPLEVQPHIVKPGTRNKPNHENSVSPLPGNLPDELKATPLEAVDASSIESILSDKELSFEESATRLLECARREELPMELRLDALDHAFNLDRWQALTLCMEKPIPTPIAERLLSGIHNFNESPEDQVSACMHLMLHEDAEIREQAQGLLAFLVSAEEHAENPDRLREAANAFLNRPGEGDGEEEMNIEHPTSNIEHPSGRK